MRETRNAQQSIFESFSKHEFGQRLKQLSDVLDNHPTLLQWVEKDLSCAARQPTGRRGISVESVFRCLLLKQILGVSYEQLAFHLSDSITYQSFTRIPYGANPGRSTLQHTIRQITPDTLQQMHALLIRHWAEQRSVDTRTLRIDSTVIQSTIAAPSDSRLLNDGIRVLCRLLAKSAHFTGIQVPFVDYRKAAKSLAFRIFNAKKAEKDRLYPELITLARHAEQQAETARCRILMTAKYYAHEKSQQWLVKLAHYLRLTRQVISQTQRRVIDGETVPTADKVVSLFEPHTDIIVKGYRDIQYGHKVNLSTETHGFITYFAIEQGNPSDKDLYLPVIDYHQAMGQLPVSTIADGGYASQANVLAGREKGIRHTAFQKRVGLSLQAMGLKSKTLKKLAHFRAGIEGNISELKRAFHAGRATWKGESGFKAYAWASVLSYNLIKFVNLKPSG